MSAPRFIGAAEVHRLLDPDSCIAVVREAMRAFTLSAAAQPLRQVVPLAPGKLFGVMPGSLAGTARFGAKLVSVFDDPARPGRRAHRGVVALFGGSDGAPLAIVDAEAVTLLRTAAASAVATDALAPPGAATLGLFGCGGQAMAHLVAIARVRPVARVLVWGRDGVRARDFAEQASQASGIEVTPVDSAMAAAQAEILCTITSAETPVLEGNWVHAGTHVNAVGSSVAGPREIDRRLVTMSRFVADSRASVLAQGAEFLEAKAAGAIDDDHIVAEIGEVLLGQVPARVSPDDITVYKSLGHVVQDLAAAAFLYDRIEELEA
jgi:ornithine cyclodeaminase